MIRKYYAHYLTKQPVYIQQYKHRKPAAKAAITIVTIIQRVAYSMEAIMQTNSMLPSLWPELTGATTVAVLRPTAP